MLVDLPFGTPQVTYRPKKGWMLTSPFEWEVRRHENSPRIRLQAPVGFRTDLASIPWLLRALPGFKCYSFGLSGPTGHDLLYRRMGRYRQYVFTRAETDSMFYALMRLEGIGWRARVAYWAVRVGGWFAWGRIKIPSQ